MRTLCHISAVVWLVAADGHAHGDLHQQITEISKQIERKPDAALYLKRGELEREHREFGRCCARKSWRNPEDATKRGKRTKPR